MLASTQRWIALWKGAPESGPVKGRLVAIHRLEVSEAGVALLALSNTLGVYGQERRNSMARLEAALRMHASS
ncbi:MULTISPECIES: hypothetical protein [unclassified Bradyrhizobium]|uniref:hypothetical protein n=1 Tax=unclassified Bradyrhizobium TaxID=2631580 RepID=UPI003396E45B